LIYNIGEGNRLVPSFELFKAKHSGDCLTPSTLNLQPSTTIESAIYTHVLRQGGAGAKSPLDCL
jgi:hypothetical protein